MKLLQQLSVMVLLLIMSAAHGQYKTHILPQVESFEVQQTITHQSEPLTTVVLDAHQFRLPKGVAQYRWRQLKGDKVDLYQTYTERAFFVTPELDAGVAIELLLELQVMDKRGRFYVYHWYNTVLNPQPDENPPLNTQRNDNEILIPAATD